jgi:hypothetical protein
MVFQNYRTLGSNYFFLLSRKEEKTQREVIQPLRLCIFARVFFYSLKERKSSAGFPRVLSFFLAKKRRRKEKLYNLCVLTPLREYFFSCKVGMTLREVIKPLRLGVFARLYSFFSQTTEAFYYSRKVGKTQREVIQPLRLRIFARVFFLGFWRVDL